MFALYERSGGKLPDQEHQTCRDVGAKTLATLTGVLATLLALHSDPPTSDLPPVHTLRRRVLLFS